MTLAKRTPSLTEAQSQLFNTSDLFVAAALLVVMGVLFAGRFVHYLLFHTMAELFAIVVSFSIFVLAWISNRYLTNGYLIVLGGSYAAVGMVDVLHTLTFKGMNLFPGVSTNIPTQYWLTARFLEAFALLLAPFAIDRKPNFHWISAGFAAMGTLLCIAVVMHWFPATFVDGVGLTPFKVVSEYIIISMMTLGLIMLWRFRDRFEPRIFSLLAASIVLAMTTEFCFTRYVNFYDFSNELGHYARFLSTAFAFMAIVLSGVRQPFEMIFREMMQNKHHLDELNAKLLENESLLKRAQQVAKVGSWHLDIANNVLRWSDETRRIFGVLPGTTLSLETFASHIHADDRASVMAAWQLALKRHPYDIEHRIVVGDQIRWVREIAEISFANDGAPLVGLGTVQDITDRKRIEATLVESELRMSAVFQSSPIGIVVSTLADGTLIDINDAALRQFGYTQDEVLGKRSLADLGTYVDPTQRDVLVQRLKQLGSLHQFPVDFLTRNGTQIVLEISGRLIELRGESCIVSLMVDVTERHRIEAQIHEQAFHDALTKLPNRRLLSDRLRKTMSSAKRSGCFAALMYLDLDNFKPLNDKHGHEVGDLLLIEMARRLKACVRESDTVARVGGDEFVVLLSELDTDPKASVTQAMVVAEKVRMGVSMPCLLSLRHEGADHLTVEHCCTVSIGIVLFVNDDKNYKTLINQADAAMYHAKRTGRNVIHLADAPIP